MSQLPSSTLSIRASLSSSRPAPPSPAPSRRASTALSQRSSSPGAENTNLSRTPPVQRQSRLQHEILPVSSDPLPESSPDSTSRGRSLLVKVRDFAYPSTDDRHLGEGPDAPNPNRHRNSSIHSLGGGGDDDIGTEERNSGWGGPMWAGLANKFGWSLGAGPGSDTPSEIVHNFDTSSPMDENESFGESNTSDGEDDEQEDGGILLPGRYRAVYSFEPQGTSEMALEEDQIVYVVGRGGGEGWAVVEKVDGGHALVPESYLEFVEP